MDLLPTAVQLELTYRCNNACWFCYNDFAGLKRPEASTDEMKFVLDHLAAANVFSVNFNGGEPLLREDFFELAEHGAALGLDLHLNTNGTLIGPTEARSLARHFAGVCITILSADSRVHDELRGRTGSLAEAERGIRVLQTEGVYVAGNVTLCATNAATLDETLRYLHLLRVQTILITHLAMPPGQRCFDALSREEIETALVRVLKYQRGPDAFARLAFPQPYPPCHFSPSIRSELRRHNIPCTAGLNTARITPSGDVTPCALLPEPRLGNLIKSSFGDIWSRFDGRTFFTSCLPTAQCSFCADLDGCGGGCVGSVREPHRRLA